MKKLLFGVIAIVLFTNLSFGQSINECNKQLEIFKSQIENTSKGEFISSDFEKPKNLNDYLSQIKKRDVIINTVYHTKLDTKSDRGILDIYTIQYSKDVSKYIIIIENQNDITQSNVIDASLDFSNQSIKLVSHTDYLVDTGSIGKRNWSKCFGDCLSAGLDSHGLLGQVIILTGAAGAVCPPCGIVSATYVGILALGCAGGCMP
jgi:hypothetical protein